MKNNINTLLIVVGIIISVTILSQAYKYKFQKDEIISVTGLAEREFESDQIVWSAYYTQNNMNLKEAYANLKKDEKEIKNYLLSKGAKDNEIKFSSVNIDKQYENSYGPNGNYVGNYFNGYVLQQSVTIDSKEIDKVERIVRESNSLIEKGIEFNSTLPSYYYSKLSELKIDLLAKASEDAKARANTIVKNAGGKVADPSKANMGVFQITGKNENEAYSYGGTFNTSSRTKTASITVKLEYKIK